MLKGIRTASWVVGKQILGGSHVLVLPIQNLLVGLSIAPSSNVGQKLLSCTVEKKV